MAWSVQCCFSDLISYSLSFNSTTYTGFLGILKSITNIFSLQGLCASLLLGMLSPRFYIVRGHFSQVCIQMSLPLLTSLSKITSLSYSIFLLSTYYLLMFSCLYHQNREGISFICFVHPCIFISSAWQNLNSEFSLNLLSSVKILHSSVDRYHCVCVRSVAQSCLTFCDSMDCINFLRYIFFLTLTEPSAWLIDSVLFQ